MKERDSTFDIMKGIAMILVISSHTIPVGNNFFAYWRSALFFIISGYFAKEWPVGEFLQKGARRLFIPYVVTCLFMLPFVLFGEFLLDVDVLTTVLKSMALGASYFGYADKYRDICIGPLWFVCASIWVRIVWALLQKIKNVPVRGVVIVLCGIAAYKLKENSINPWSIFSAFGALGFFYCGYVIRKYDVLSSPKGKSIMPIALLCLYYCISFKRMDVSSCVYGGGYITTLIACTGAFMLLYAGVKMFANKNMRFWKFLNFFGRYSLVAFCIHSVDQCLTIHWFPFKLWWQFSTTFEYVCAVVMRVGFAAIGCYLVSKNKFLKEKIFFIKD